MSWTDTDDIRNSLDLQELRGKKNLADYIDEIQDAVDDKADSSHTHTVSDIPTITATAAELNHLDGITADVNELNILDGVTAIAAEVNLVDGIPGQVSFSIAAGGANVCWVTIQTKDAAGTNIARPVPLLVWLSDAATGAGLTGTGASGTVQAKSGAGTDFGTLTAKKALIVQTLADGSYILEITDTAKTGFYVGCEVLGAGLARGISRQLTSGDYGA